MLYVVFTNCLCCVLLCGACVVVAILLLRVCDIVSASCPIIVKFLSRLMFSVMDMSAYAYYYGFVRCIVCSVLAVDMLCKCVLLCMLFWHACARYV